MTPRSLMEHDQGNTNRVQQAGACTQSEAIVRQVNDEGNSTGELPERQAPDTVRKIFESTSRGKSALEIAIELNKSGIPAPSAGLRQRTLVESILRNEAHAQTDDKDRGVPGTTV